MESAPFECKICGRVVKYDRNTVHTHLKNVHGITWAIYLDRIRKERRGETLDDLPALETHECKVCNVSVKYIREVSPKVIVIVIVKKEYVARVRV